MLVSWRDILLPHHLLLLKVWLPSILHAALVLRQELWAFLMILHATGLRQPSIEKLWAGSYQIAIDGLNHLTHVNNMLSRVASMGFYRSNCWGQSRVPILNYLCVVMLDFVRWTLCWGKNSVVWKRMVVWLHLWLPAPSNSHFFQKNGIDFTLHLVYIYLN